MSGPYRNETLWLHIAALIVIAALLYCSYAPLSEEFAHVYVGEQRVKAEVARTPREWKKGLTRRIAIPPDYGCLFDMRNQDRWAACTEGMKFSMDVLFIKDQKIVDLWLNAPPSKRGNPLFFFPNVNADFSLEVNAGFVQNHGISVGDPVRIDFIGRPERGE